MTKGEIIGITLEPSTKGGYTAFAPVDWVLSHEGDAEKMLKKAAEIYEKKISVMRSIIAEIESRRKSPGPIPARLVWKLGNKIFEIKDELEKYNFQIEGLYDHLERDLGKNRKWLEKVITFRRYIPGIKYIPADMGWGIFTRDTKKTALRLIGNSPLKN